MPTFSRSLEQSLHRALALANERHHEYATLEHLLLALIDDQDAAAVMRACNVDTEKLKRNLVELSRIRTGKPGHRRRRGQQAHRGLPARDPARRDPRAVVRPRRGDRRQCAGRDLRRAREPRRLFPARAGHDPLRRGQLHQPRHRQAAGPVGNAERARQRRGFRCQGRQRRRGWRAEEEGRRARGLLHQPQQEGQGRQDRSADRPRVRDQPHHPGAVPAAEEQSALCRRGRRRQDRDRRRVWRGASSMAKCRMC